MWQQAAKWPTHRSTRRVRGRSKWLHHRLVKVHGQIDPTVARMSESLRGTAKRVKDNGLGFDITRLASQADKTAKWVDPVIEVLAFFGLALLPVRGTGTDKGINKSARSSARQRGWRRLALANGQTELCFLWPAWNQPLDFDGIDALLDIWQWSDRSRWGSVGNSGWMAYREVSKARSGGHNEGFRLGAAVMEAIVIPISAIEHFVYCPRQCALIHCDGVWADNAHTVRGSRAHRRVNSGKARRERGKLVLRAIPLWSEELGLTGRADAVELDGDVVRPVEYKSGVPHGTAADLQVCAQAMCLEPKCLRSR